MARDLGPPRSPGAPTDCTPGIQKTILDALTAGNYRKTAAAAAGIHRKTLENWEKAGLEGREPYASFLSEMVKAEAACELALVAEARADKGAAWILERRYAADWCSRVKQATTEAVDALTEKLKANPEVHKQVVAILSETDSATPGAQH